MVSFMQQLNSRRALDQRSRARRGYIILSRKKQTESGFFNAAAEQPDNFRSTEPRTARSQYLQELRCLVYFVDFMHNICYDINGVIWS